MMNCMIIDDEVLALDLLEDYIRKVPYLRLVRRCTNAMDAMDELQKNTVHLVFSDIQMHGLSGLQLVKTLTTKPMFVMVTAYTNYAVESYELDIVDYLVKPVSYERFLKACNKALAIHNSTQKADVLPEYVFFQVDYSHVKVVLDEVVYVEGLKDYVKIHFTGGKRPLLIRHSMKGVEETFPASRFLRIHKSYIVNTNCITTVRKNSLFLGTLELPVSEQYKDVVQQFVNRK